MGYILAYHITPARSLPRETAWRRRCTQVAQTKVLSFTGLIRGRGPRGSFLARIGPPPTPSVLFFYSSYCRLRTRHLLFGDLGRLVSTLLPCIKDPPRDAWTTEATPWGPLTLRGPREEKGQPAILCRFFNFHFSIQNVQGFVSFSSALSLLIFQLPCRRDQTLSLVVFSPNPEIEHE